MDKLTIVDVRIKSKSKLEVYRNLTTEERVFSRRSETTSKLVILLQEINL